MGPRSGVGVKVQINSSIAARWLIALAAIAFPLRAGAQAPITWSVTFDDPGGTYQTYYNDIQSTLVAAGNEWATHLVVPAPRTIDIEVRFLTTLPRSSGYSKTSAFVKNVGGVNVYEQGIVAKLETGQEPNNVTPDAYLDINPTYLQNELWFDPDPTQRTAPVPADRTDAYSVIIHELTHAIAFNGWRDGQSGSIPGTPPYESTFDLNESFDGSNLWFNGPLAESLYGGPVPITFANNWHIGNNPPRPGSNLLQDLMNGVIYYRGTRYDLSALDLAMATDSGTPTNFIPGDVNADGHVGFDDLVALARHYGQSSANLSEGDVNSDGVVNFSDLVLLARHYGQSASTALEVAAVPEPTAAGLLMAACAAALAFRPRRRARCD